MPTSRRKTVHRATVSVSAVLVLFGLANPARAQPPADPAAPVRQVLSDRCLSCHEALLRIDLIST